MVTINEQETVNYKAEKFVDNEDVQAYFYPEIKVMHFVWIRKCTGEKYRENYTLALDFAEKNDAIYFISDLRKQGVVGPEDRKWFELVAIPGAIERGLTKAAVVFDGNAFKMYYLNMLLMVFNKFSIPMKLFKSTQPAIDWLLEK